MSSPAVRDAIVHEARAWLGVPYLHQGRTRHGIDCIGLLIKIAHSLGLSRFDIDGYSRLPSGRMMSRLMREHMSRLAISEALPGDVLHMSFGMQPQHVAIITKLHPVSVIHADSERGKVVEHVLDAQWMRHVRGVYRVNANG